MRGVEVVGAWMWDSKLNFGLVSEIAAREVFFMANAVDAGIRIMYGLTLVVVLISVGMMRQTHPRLTMGSRFGPYKLLKRIGEGGLGEVFLAQHELMKRFAAIKILRADAHNRDCISLFEREVQATSLLSHPNTVAIYDFGRATDGRLFYAMEFLSGLSLAKLLSMEPQLPVPRVVHFLIQIISSLREAHHIGLVHRDIKPLNIMICRKGCEYDVVKVLDFGLVKPLKSEALPEIILSSSKGLYGTPLFMAPECLQDPAACDVRVDIYALGVVAYRMLSGQNPFSSTHELALMYDVLFTEPEPLYQLKPDLDHDLAALVMRCLAKDPELRPQSMDELREHFSQFKANWVWTNEDAWNWWKGHAEHLNEINPGPLSSNVRIEG
jgi:serine/threonine protein kinase